MPSRAVCHSCGAILYESKHPYELAYPPAIIEKYNGKCPNCGRKLSCVPVSFKIIKLKGKKR